MADDADRTIPATPRRREAARRAGLMPPAALPAWAAGAVTALVAAPAWARATIAATAEWLRALAIPGGDAALMPPPAVVLPTLGLVVAAGGAALVVRLACDGFSWRPGRAAFDPRRIDPRAGLARIFSWDTLTAVVGDGLALAGLATVAVLCGGPLVGFMGREPGADATAAAGAVGQAALLRFAAAAAVVAGCHWALGRRRFEQRIRMTPQELADERREVEADPRVRLLQQGRRRQPAAASAGTA